MVTQLVAQSGPKIQDALLPGPLCYPFTQSPCGSWALPTLFYEVELQQIPGGGVPFPLESHTSGTGNSERYAIFKCGTRRLLTLICCKCLWEIKYWQVCPTAAQPRDHSLFWSIYVNSSVLSSLLVTHRILLPKIYTKIQESFI